jgi:hypothetical protein
VTSFTFISLSLLFLIPRIYQVIFIDHRDAALAENYCKLPHWKTKPCLWLYNMYHTEHSMLPRYSLQTPTQTCYPHWGFSWSITCTNRATLTLHLFTFTFTYLSNEMSGWPGKVKKRDPSSTFKNLRKNKNMYRRCKQLPRKNSTS